ncbi:hypothetical protein CRUP_027169 [Coryphaenoides rupestris]|nr:hypothetical protein CRUP_027169 [Coryphaenoides rupestris]
MEYQAEQENPDGTPVPMSLNSIKSDVLHKDPETLTFQGDELSPVERNVLVGADDLLYGEPYKPMGFESSFLKFIQEQDMEEDLTPIKRKDSLRRSCSVKENNQLGVPLTRSKRTRSPPLKRSAMADDFTSVQNWKSIMDKALSGCGDLAIKQLQYLRPVVVLERPMCTTSTTLPDLIPHELTN